MKIEKFAWLFVILMILISVGCSMSDNGNGNTLALQGYRDIEIERVLIATPTRYDPEKQGETIRLGLERTIDHSQLWFRGGSPKAIVEVRITEFHEPSKGKQFLGVDGYKVSFVVRARDAMSGQPLGEASGSKRWRMGGGVIGKGIGAAFAEQQLAEHFGDTNLQNFVTQRATMAIAQTIGEAKERRPVMSVPTMPTLSPQRDTLVAVSSLN